MKFTNINNNSKLSPFKLFHNQILDSIQDDNNLSSKVTTILIQLVNNTFDRLERLEILKKSGVFNELEAAIYLRLSDPERAGRQTIRYHALKSKKLSFLKIGRDGLIFTKKDLDSFIENEKIKSYRSM